MTKRGAESNIMTKIERHKIMEDSRQRNVSIIKDAEGNSIVMINDIVFKGKRFIDWDSVEAYLKGNVGDIYKILESDDMIYIGSDLPDEFSHSKYNESLSGARLKAKANAAVGLREIVNISRNKTYKNNEKAKHIKDAPNGWYRYDTKFALPVYDSKGDLIRYNVYNAALVVRCDKDNKLYLYDIINIKKEMGEPAS